MAEWYTVEVNENVFGYPKLNRAIEAATEHLTRAVRQRHNVQVSVKNETGKVFFEAHYEINP